MWLMSDVCVYIFHKPYKWSPTGEEYRVRGFLNMSFLILVAQQHIPAWNSNLTVSATERKIIILTPKRFVSLARKASLWSEHFMGLLKSVWSFYEHQCKYLSWLCHDFLPRQCKNINLVFNPKLGDIRKRFLDSAYNFYDNISRALCVRSFGVFIKKSNSASDTILGVISAKVYLWRRRGARDEHADKSISHIEVPHCAKRLLLAYVAEKREVSIRHHSQLLCIHGRLWLPLIKLYYSFGRPATGALEARGGGAA